MSFKRPRVIRRIKDKKAIKESFDTLPMAVCFFDGDGIARLVNRRMLEVSEQLLGSGAQTLCELMAALEKPPEGIEPLEGGKSVYRFPDGRVLRFCESKVTDPYGNAYTEVTASDVTELIELQNELKAENASLEDANRRIRELSRAMPELIREEETLAMKMRVHDDIGHTILAVRQALRCGFDMETIRESAAEWERSIDLLRRAGRADDCGDPIEYARGRAEQLGVDVITEGELPTDEPRRHLLGLAIRECASNAVKHAGASHIYVMCKKTDDTLEACVTNDGTAPLGKIREGGGLSGIRRRTEEAGGVMNTRSAPRFMLTLAMPEKHEKEDDMPW